MAEYRIMIVLKVKKAVWKKVCTISFVGCVVEKINWWLWTAHKWNYLSSQSRVLLEKPTCSAGEEIHHVLRNPKVHYRVRKSPPLVLVLSHVNPVHTFISFFLKINFIILPSTTRSSKWFLSLGLLTKFLYPYRSVRLGRKFQRSVSEQ
jgi:hypothetical protein